jgi:hypothetical protein
MRRFVFALAVFFLVFVAVRPEFAAAASEVTRSKTIDAADINSLTVKAAVGAVRIERAEIDAIEVQVRLKAKRTTGIFSSLPDVETIEVSATTRGDQLTLEIDAKNVEERWVVQVPAKILSALSVKLAVGGVSITAPAKRIEVDVGVGDANLDVPSGAISLTLGTGDGSIRTALKNAGPIEGKTGVGSASISGVNGSVRSSTIGGSIKGEGKGREPIEATVGVGDLSITLYE